MGGLFGSKPDTPAPIPPAAPVEQATFQPGGADQTTKDMKAKAQGKKKLQVPVTDTNTAGLAIPTTTTQA